MGQPSKKLVEDVELLLEQVVLEEATAAVWAAFEKSLNTLDGESLQLLRKHLDGTPLTKIASERNITESEAKVWVEKTKQSIIENIRRDFKVRQ